MAQLITQLVVQVGFVVDHERTAEGALSAARGVAYDLVLLDRRLPDADGMALLAPLARSRLSVLADRLRQLRNFRSCL